MEAKDIRRDPITELPPLTPLQTALIQAGVPPFNDDDVLQYQAEMLTKARQKQKSGPKRGWPLTLILLGGAIVSTGLGFELHNFDFWGPAPTIMAFATTGFLLACSIAAWCKSRIFDPTLMLDWRRYTVAHSYGGNLGILNPVHVPQVGSVRIPDEVVNVALKIAKTGIAAAFELVQLDHDPFLVVVDGRERYYVAVWDEKGFCG